MFTDPSLTLADQMLGIVAVFLKTLAAEACKLRIGWVSCAIWNRVRRLERRFLALYALWKAGTLPPPRPAAVKRLKRSERGEALSEGAAMSVRPASLLPRGVRWM